MAKKFVAYFGVSKAYMLDAESEDEVHELLDQLLKNDRALEVIKNDLVDRCEDPDDFMVTCEPHMQFAGVDPDWGTRINDLLEL